jgi:hypothetical protein
VSVAKTANVETPDAVGVPETKPAEFNVNPAGSEPLKRLKVYGPVPPLAVMVWLNAVPTVPADSEVSEIAGQLATATLYTLVPEQLFPSVACTVNV